ncbi:MAG: class I SAM-dependent methyltransferase [Phycisphaerales bacterium]|nr:class I SAM-dependent methyltransferase [Planctomycetota bacterium]MCH8509295.1 class I SAM-dependent methyltransferase [Phycisphaerales bacterium]
MKIPFIHSQSRTDAGPGRVGLDTASDSTTLRELFRGCPDAEWLWALTDGRAEHPCLRRLFPALPEEQFQKQFTGRSNRDTFTQAIDATNLFLGEARALGLDLDRPGLEVLDFGCGWGRITQTLFRDFDPARITGCDVADQALAICRETRLGCELIKIPYLPPTELSEASADLIVAYSVFSHLSEDAHMAWVEELARVLRPGGVLVVTTRCRAFIDYTESVRRQPEIPPHALGTAASFRDPEAWKQRYDRGEFCFDGANNGQHWPDDYYGEAVVPEGFASAKWSRFFTQIRFTPAEKHGKFDQSVIAARKSG